MGILGCSPRTHNIVKLSSPILLQRTVSYDAGTTPPRPGSAYTEAMADKNKASRRRRSSSILQVYHEPQETVDQLSDQASLPNLNANWVNGKGRFAANLSSHLARGWMLTLKDQTKKKTPPKKAPGPSTSSLSPASKFSTTSSRGYHRRRHGPWSTSRTCLAPTSCSTTSAESPSSSMRGHMTT